MKLLVIIPTYNEIDNITKLIPEVFSMIPENAGILIVDDGSPDGTANAVKALQKPLLKNQLNGGVYKSIPFRKNSKIWSS